MASEMEKRNIRFIKQLKQTRKETPFWRVLARLFIFRDIQICRHNVFWVRRLNGNYSRKIKL